MDIQVRTRRPPSEHEIRYGRYAADMVRDSKYFLDVRDRAAYLYIVGNFPSHLRKEYTAALRQFSRRYRKPTSLDGKIGREYLNPDIANDLRLDAHPMVVEVRLMISRGYLIQGSRGFGTRNTYREVYMFQPGPDQTMTNRITIKLDGAYRQGWGQGF